MFRESSPEGMLVVLRSEADSFVVVTVDWVYVMPVSWEVNVVGVAGVELVSNHSYHWEGAFHE